MQPTALRRALRALRNRPSSLTTVGCLQRIQRHFASSARAPSSVSTSFSSEPIPLHLFENASVRESRYSFLPENVLSHQAVSWARHTVQSIEHSREAQSAFYDASSCSCVVCGLGISGSYRSHQASVDHATRIAIVERTLALFHTFYSQAATAASPTAEAATPSTSTARRSRGRHHNFNPGLGASGGGMGAGAGTAREQRVKAAQSCYYTPYTQSFLFDEPSVPNRAVLHHRPKTLEELDLVDVLLKRWWRHLHQAPPHRGGHQFSRILSLSADELQTRLYRLRYLLYFLFTRGVLRESVGQTPQDERMKKNMPAGVPQLHRSEAFERFEQIGDLEFKCFATDRLQAILPADEGGIADGMREFGRILDSNHGLLAIYDYLNFDDLFSFSLANNKSKADVVEALAGELRALLASTEVTYNTDGYTLPGERASVVYLHAVVEHTLYELGHVVTMWRLDATLRGAKDVIMAALTEEFARGKRTRGHSTTTSPEKEEESDAGLMEHAPPHALRPLLLPWERRHGGVRTAKDAADFALERRPARSSQTFHLTTQPSTSLQERSGGDRRVVNDGERCAVTLGRELRNGVVVRLPCSPAALHKRVKADVADVLTRDVAVPPRASAGVHSSPADDAAVPFTSREEMTDAAAQATVMPDLLSSPCPRDGGALHRAAMAELLRANCVVICDSSCRSGRAP